VDRFHLAHREPLIGQNFGYELADQRLVIEY
jgi:hypothetical protein